MSAMVDEPAKPPQCWATKVEVTREEGVVHLRCDLNEGHPPPCHMAPTATRASGTLAAAGLGAELERQRRKQRA